jgi:Ca2+-binding RTX toxin-like protein
VLRALAIAFVLLALVPAHAFGGVFSRTGSTIVYTGDDGEDKIAAFAEGDRLRFTQFGAAGLGAILPCQLSADNRSVVCDAAGVSAVLLSLAGGDDVAAISPAMKVPVTLDGGDDDDGLFGGGGFDTFIGGAGNDNIVSRDGNAEPTVNCGTGEDTVFCV